MPDPLLPPVRELGDEPAVSVAGTGLSYAELREAAAAVAAEVAVLEAGLALVPVNPKLGRSELEHVLTDSDPDVILGAPDHELPGSARRAAVDLSARGGDLPAPR